jgi:hypothetical protein
MKEKNIFGVFFHPSPITHQNGHEKQQQAEAKCFRAGTLISSTSPQENFFADFSYLATLGAARTFKQSGN